MGRVGKNILLALVLLPMIAGLLQDLAGQLAGRYFRVDGWVLLGTMMLVPLLLRVLFRCYVRHSWKRRCLAALRTAFLAHSDKLALNRTRLMHADEYGLEDPGRWNAHLERFIQKLVLPQLTPRQQAFFTLHFHAFALALLDEAARQKKRESLGSLRPGRKLSGADFEQYCMAELRKQDWRARPTAASGDQGADIIAEHRGKAVVFQCKYHSAPVGNKAVQEVAAARHYYRAHAACVVSNQGYTRSARDLAATNNVFLIHYSELPRFRKLAFTG